MPEPTHWLDTLAEEVSTSLDSEADWYAEAIRGGARSPFSAPVSEKEKLDTYVRTFFEERPDGTIDWDKPNEDKRAKLMQSAGIKNYVEAAQAVMHVRPKTGVRPLDQLIALPPSALPPMQPQPQPDAYAGPPLGPPPQDMGEVQSMDMPQQAPPPAPGLAAGPPPGPPLG
jgi:hypothetical protein